MWRLILSPVLLALLPFALTACAAKPADDATELARRTIAGYCGSCHVVPGVSEAHGRVGPDLSHVGEQQVIGGRLPNSRENMILWITHAQIIAPGSAMPDIPLTPKEAAAVADYLYSLD